MYNALFNLCFFLIITCSWNHRREEHTGLKRNPQENNISPVAEISKRLQKSIQDGRGRETVILKAANSKKAATCHKQITGQPAFIDAALGGLFRPFLPLCKHQRLGILFFHEDTALAVAEP